MILAYVLEPEAPKLDADHTAELPPRGPVERRSQMVWVREGSGASLGPVRPVPTSALDAVNAIPAPVVLWDPEPGDIPLW